MTSGELAKRLGVSGETIRQWTARYASHLSPRATGAAPGEVRRYSRQDGEALALVASARAEGESWETIEERLSAGERGELREEPRGEGEGLEYPPAPLLWGQLQEARGELGAVTNERDRLATALASEQEARREAIERAARAEGYVEALKALSGQGPPVANAGDDPTTKQGNDPAPPAPRSPGFWDRLFGRG